MNALEWLVHTINGLIQGYIDDRQQIIPEYSVHTESKNISSNLTYYNTQQYYSSFNISSWYNYAKSQAYNSDLTKEKINAAREFTSAIDATLKDESLSIPDKLDEMVKKTTNTIQDIANIRSHYKEDPKELDFLISVAQNIFSYSCSICEYFVHQENYTTNEVLPLSETLKIEKAIYFFCLEELLNLQLQKIKHKEMQYKIHYSQYTIESLSKNLDKQIQLIISNYQNPPDKDKLLTLKTTYQNIIGGIFMIIEDLKPMLQHATSGLFEFKEKLENLRQDSFSIKENKEIQNENNENSAAMGLSLK